MDASVIGDTGKEVLYWMKSGGFALCREDAEHWKCGEVSREGALSWCREKGLPERDYLPAFGLWEHFTVNEKGKMIFPGEPLIFRAAGPMVPVKRERRQEDAYRLQLSETDVNDVLSAVEELRRSHRGKNVLVDLQDGSQIQLHSDGMVSFLWEPLRFTPQGTEERRILAREVQAAIEWE